MKNLGLTGRVATVDEYKECAGAQLAAIIPFDARLLAEVLMNAPAKPTVEDNVLRRLWRHTIAPLIVILVYAIAIAAIVITPYLFWSSELEIVAATQQSNNKWSVTGQVLRDGTRASELQYLLFLRMNQGTS